MSWSSDLVDLSNDESDAVVSVVENFFGSSVPTSTDRVISKADVVDSSYHEVFGGGEESYQYRYTINFINFINYVIVGGANL